MRALTLGLCASLLTACVDRDADSPNLLDQGLDHQAGLETMYDAGSMAGQMSLAGAEVQAGETNIVLPAPDQVSVATYNVQNLFDFNDDPDHDEGEYTPNVAQWSRETYDAKLSALAEVFILIDADIITLQEVESEDALSDLAEVILSKGGKDYRYQGISSSRDPRGIALGVLSIYPFDREIGRPISTSIDCVNGDSLDGSRPEARPIYEINFWSDGTGIGEQSLTLLVNHWKSRASGDYPCQVREHHERGARQIRDLINSWLNENPNRAVIVLGDFNAEENETSLSQSIDAYINPAEVNGFALYNLWGELGVSASSNNNATNSTYRYDGNWFRLDHIMISPSIMNNGNGPWRLDNFSLIRDAQLFRNGSPNSWSNQYRSGYSDHLPLRVSLRLR